VTRSTFTLTTALAVLLALGVVLLDTHVRLSDAGPGCPDWPDCAGQLIGPEANTAYPRRPVEPGEARKEIMLHRLLAGALGLVVLGLAIAAWRGRRRRHDLPLAQPLILVALVVVQWGLGMLTVTLPVKPLVATAQLAGGMATLGAACWMLLGRLDPGPGLRLHHFRPWAIGGLLLLCCQILLGGWLSTNDAYPVPEMDARAAIEIAHRLGALVMTLYLGTFGILLYRASTTARQHILAEVLLAALALQVCLGVTDSFAHLPLSVAVAHHCGAAVLLLTLLTVIRALGARTRTDPARARIPVYSR